MNKVPTDAFEMSEFDGFEPCFIASRAARAQENYKRQDISEKRFSTTTVKILRSVHLFWAPKQVLRAQILSAQALSCLSESIVILWLPGLRFIQRI